MRYLVCRTHYTDRLPNNAEFATFCELMGVEPLFTVDSTGTKQTQFLFDGNINSVSPSITERVENDAVLNRLKRNNMGPAGVVVMKINSFEQASKVFLQFNDLRYCTINGISVMKLLGDMNGVVDTVYVKFDTSGRTTA